MPGFPHRLYPGEFDCVDDLYSRRDVFWALRVVVTTHKMRWAESGEHHTNVRVELCKRDLERLHQDFHPSFGARPIVSYVFRRLLCPSHESLMVNPV